MLGVAAVDDQRERIDGGLVDENIDSHKVGCLKAEKFIVHRRVAVRDAF